MDIENSSARNIDASVLIDVQGGIPTRLACKVCHDRIDPVAGAFQRYGQRGIYLDGAFGMDTLDNSYKTTNFYKPGDLWYRSMLAPGFEGETFILSNLLGDQDPLRLLADRLSKHPKFAEGTIKFWWPAIFGEEFMPYSLDDAELQLRQMWLAKFSKSFIESGYNLKQLLSDFIMSPFFRSTLAPTNPYKKSKRLLTPEELQAKTRSLTQYDDARLANDWLINYGGIDSYNVEQRQRTFSSMLYQIAKRHAADTSCFLVKSLNEKLKKKHSNSEADNPANLTVALSNPLRIKVINQTDPYIYLLKNLSSAPINIQVEFTPTGGLPADVSVLSIAASAESNSIATSAEPNFIATSAESNSISSSAASIAIAPGAIWVSPINTEGGEWRVSTDSPAPQALEATKIQFDKQSILADLSDFAFNFWGDPSVETIQELFDFYLAAHQSTDVNLVKACISTQEMQSWRISELAAWRMVYLRLLTDYDYLYE